MDTLQSKTRINLTIHPDIIRELKAKHINISEIVGNFLLNYLNIRQSTDEVDYNKMQQELVKLKAKSTKLEQDIFNIEERKRKNEEEYKAKVKSGEILVIDADDYNKN